ncbi:autotransporter outer membrane beta-barrel domain-containing protein, partial [Aquamicrobium segne]
MNKYYYIIALIGLSISISGNVLADDCTVTGDSLVCEPDGSYNPSDHGGKLIYDYDQISLTTTISLKHGLSQASGDTTYNNVTINTSGDRADGIHVIQWGPKITFKSLNINASGYSADGILVGRDSTGAIITVNGDTNILSSGGMGVRSVTTAKKDGINKNKIILNGNSIVKTTADGSRHGGHAVYAGVDLSGCGPFGLPLNDCLSSDRAEIFLTEGNNNLHNIITSGASANGIYAYGYGYVKTSNVQIETTGENAHGIAAVRRNSNYYYDSSDSGSQDYSGVVELTGNVFINTSGNGAFAILADSGNASNGQDSLGVVSSVRSFDSDSGQIVSDKIYQINGNLHAKNSGIIDLSMGNHSTFDGYTKLESNGIINLDIDGDKSIWHMSGSSILNTVNLLSGASLRPYEINGNVYDYTITGNLHNEGKIILEDGFYGSRAGDEISLIGDYTSHDGLLIIDTKLHDDDSITDHLLIDGDTSGRTYVRVQNDQGTGAQTNEGIKIIDVTGSSAGTFSLLGDYMFEGDQAVVGGAYA